MILADFHIHTSFSDDSDTEMETAIERALELGLTEIAVTDHQDFLYNGKPNPHLLDVEQYISTVYRLRERYADKLRLTLGLETGLSADAISQTTALVNSHPFDFVIGSSHDAPTAALYYGDYFHNKTKTEAYTEYFEITLKNIRSLDCYDVYGHLDYIPRYAPYAENSLLYSDYADIIDEILRELIARGKGLEVNTSGYRYGLDTAHPQTDILKRYRELGGEIITVGSDAHFPQHIGLNFDRAEASLREAGFTAYTLFRERKPVWKDL